MKSTATTLLALGLVAGTASAEKGLRGERKLIWSWISDIVADSTGSDADTTDNSIAGLVDSTLQSAGVFDQQDAESWRDQDLPSSVNDLVSQILNGKSASKIVKAATAFAQVEAEGSAGIAQGIVDGIISGSSVDEYVNAAFDIAGLDYAGDDSVSQLVDNILGNTGDVDALVTASIGLAGIQKSDLVTTDIQAIVDAATGTPDVSAIVSSVVDLKGVLGGDITDLIDSVTKDYSQYSDVSSVLDFVEGIVPTAQWDSGVKSIVELSTGDDFDLDAIVESSLSLGGQSGYDWKSHVVGCSEECNYKKKSVAGIVMQAVGKNKCYPVVEKYLSSNYYLCSGN